MNDDTLTLYYYRDGLTRGERQQITTALASDSNLAHRYRDLSRQLEQLGSVSDSPPAPDMVLRWHESIKNAARVKTKRQSTPASRPWSLVWGAGIAASLAIGIVIGILVSKDPTVEPVPQESFMADLHQPGPVTSTGSSAFHRGLQVHFRESERDLSATPMSATEDRTLLIRDIVAQNRLFQMIAQQNDSQSLVRVLRSFELVLLRLAAEDISPEEAEALHAKLLFELNVMLTKLARDTSNEQLSI